MVCKKQELHPKKDCEDSDGIAAREYRKSNSDLFKPRGFTPAAQKEIMIRNASVSPLLRLPAEIRLRIYKLVLGGQKLWIDYAPPESVRHRHRGGRFFATSDIDDKDLNLCLPRVCRHIFTETSLLPFALNEFFFETGKTRRMFEKSTRPGKKRVQKKAIGESKIMNWASFEKSVLWKRKKLPSDKLLKWSTYAQTLVSTTWVG